MIIFLHAELVFYFQMIHELVGLADDGIGEILGVGNALHHGGGPAHGVAAGVDALEIGLEGGPALIRLRNGSIRKASNSTSS